MIVRDLFVVRDLLLPIVIAVGCFAAVAGLSFTFKRRNP